MLKLEWLPWKLFNTSLSNALNEKKKNTQSLRPRAVGSRCFVIFMIVFQHVNKVEIVYLFITIDRFDVISIMASSYFVFFFFLLFIHFIFLFFYLVFIVAGVHSHAEKINGTNNSGQRILNINENAVVVIIGIILHWFYFTFYCLWIVSHHWMRNSIHKDCIKSLRMTFGRRRKKKHYEKCYIHSLSNQITR